MSIMVYTYKLPFTNYTILTPHSGGRRVSCLCDVTCSLCLKIIAMCICVVLYIRLIMCTYHVSIEHVKMCLAIHG